MQKSFLLLSGSPRSGTTWIAEILGASPCVNYIKGEPFNPGVSKALFGIEWDEWYTDLHLLPPSFFKNELSNAFNLHWSLKLLFHRFNYSVKYGNVKDILRNFKYLLLSLNNKPSFIKDPMAVFALEKVYQIFNPQIIITIRHPAAFVGSMLRVNWGFGFQCLENKNRLIQQIVSNYHDDINMLNTFHYQDKILERSTIFWCIVYEYLYHLLQKYPEWILISHDSLSLNPVKEFKILFEKLGFRYNHEVEKKIIKTSNAKNPVNAKNGEIHNLCRNSAKNIHSWKEQLSHKQIDYIISKTEKVRKLYYPK